MRYLLAILLLIAPVAKAATGDILSCTVRDDGWSVDVVFDGYSDGDLYDFHLVSRTNIVLVSGSYYTNIFLTPGPNTPKLELMSPGFDSSGVSNWTARTVYLVSEVRSNYPNQAVNDERVGVSTVTNRISLSDFVFTEDGTITFTAPSAVYSNNNAVAALAVGNSSLLSWGGAKAIANWTKPGWNQETGSTMRLSAVGFGHWGADGQPLSRMEFIATGEDGVKVTNGVTTMRIDRTMNDALPFAEYYTNVTLTGFAHSNRLRCDFRAIPRYGIEASVLDTRNNLYTWPNALPCAITNFYFTNTYSVIAVVDTNGINANGAATNTSPENVLPEHYFQTMNAALVAIKGTNNTMFGHNDCGGGIVYLRSNVNTNMGGTGSTAGTPTCWVTVKPYPGDAVTLNQHSGNQDISDRVKIEGIKIGYTSTMLPYVNSDGMWFKDCIWDSTGSGPLSSGCRAVWVTGGIVSRWSQGFRAVNATYNTQFSLRGINFSNMNSSIVFNTMVGCTKTNYGGTSFLVQSDLSGWTGTAPDFQIMYNNRLLYVSNAIAISPNFPTTNGMAIVQNEIEQLTASGVAPYTIAGLGAVRTTNIIWLNNTLEGDRQLYLYDSALFGSTNTPRVLCQSKNSVFTNPGEATDTDTSGGSADGNRVGDWPVRWRVGSHGNVIQMLNYLNTHGGLEFQGLETFYPGGFAVTSSNLMQYVDRKGGGVGTGGGNYRLKSSSPILTIPTERILPHDIEGVYRGGFDPPGAYASASPRKGGAFFGQ